MQHLLVYTRDMASPGCLVPASYHKKCTSIALLFSLTKLSRYYDLPIFPLVPSVNAQDIVSVVKVS